MKTSYHTAFRTMLVLIFFLIGRLSGTAQGRVVINEYMPWTLNGCGATSEFIELLNFGPGPINISCYILTDGDFSITIPANTILQPGEFYVISGQDVLTYPCANIDSTVHSDLNWNTCNCASDSIPTTGDGFLSDGGYANEQVVLLDPNLNVVDAVARSLPVESSSLITTSSVGGQCTPRVFDLDLMSINYETIGESAGRGNSFARRLDGDCGWVKDPQQSANATNNTPGDISSVSYSLTYIEPLACPLGSVAITVSAEGYSDIFPMHYTLAYDTDNDGIFELTDQYSTGTDSTSPSIPISNLAMGNYSITLASDKGCNLYTIDFTILDCLPLLALKILSFEARQFDNNIECKWSIANAEHFARADIEKSTDGISFQKALSILSQDSVSGKKDFRALLTGITDGKICLRLVVYDKNGGRHLSQEIIISNKKSTSLRLWPNPVHNKLNLEINSDQYDIASYQLLDNENRLLLKGRLQLKQGINTETIEVNSLPKGNYRLVIGSVSSAFPPYMKSFIKL